MRLGARTRHRADETGRRRLEIFRFVHFSRINYRTHRKSLVIDGALGFIGGVGIADAWKGNGRIHGLWRDSHYRVRGPVVAQLQEAFMDNWLDPGGVAARGSLFSPTRMRGKQMCQIFKSSAGEGSDSARLMLLVSIAAARDRIRIANVYFIPDNLTMQTLLEALHRGVKVEIITPGTDIDAQNVRAVGKTRWKPCSKPGRAFTSISLRDSTASICSWMTAGHRSARPISTIAPCH